MAQRSVKIREFSRPTLEFLLKNQDIGVEENAGTAVNITGYAFHLTVKRALTDPDAQALVSVAGVIVTAADGTFSFTLTTAHTGMPPGETYFAEIRIWTDGVTTNPPHYSLPVSWQVDAAVDQVP